MKKQITIEAHTCDCCGVDQSYVYTCLECGVEHCCECSKTKGVEYPHAVYFSGSGDGYYCKPCDAKSLEPLHEAYLAISQLRRESEAWARDFKQRSDAAERRIKQLSLPTPRAGTSGEQATR